MYDIKNAQFVWRGITLSGFGDDHRYSITQNGDSVTPYKGVAGEGMNIKNHQRMWTITTTLKADSTSLPILIEDNLRVTEGDLVIRDLNTEISDSFGNAVIMNISGEQDSNTRTVTWSALTRNGK